MKSNRKASRGRTVRRRPQNAGLFQEIVVDLFAGGGGASIGIERGIGRAVDIAINHDPLAVACHSANHPHTRHIETDIWEVEPIEATGGRPVGLLWASPDCRHFSRAKGAKPVSKRVRSLAWVVCKWARDVRPRVIMLENVREFQPWGPLDKDGRPCPTRKGQTFRRWVSMLKSLGYAVEWRILDAAEYGAPTHRKRLFVVARRDGQPIEWPTPTHGPGLPSPYRTAAECIDWTIPCPSIFDREKPLAEKTLRRIALGLVRYVLQNPRPFIVDLAWPADDRHNKPVDEPIGTQTTRHSHALVTPYLGQAVWGEGVGQDPRVRSLERPLGVIDATGERHHLITAMVSKFYGGVVGHGLDRPLGTVTAVDHHALTTATLVKAHANGWDKDDSGARDVELDGQPYVVADIGLRMLTPRELARCQGFGDDYALPPTSRHAVRLIGNSVCPPVAEAMVRANYQELQTAQRRAGGAA